jgi:calcineurin-like phosphoesterase family protein
MGRTGMFMDERQLGRSGTFQVRVNMLRSACACVLACALCAVHAAAAAADDPVLAAAGDIACAPGDSDEPCQQLATANLAAGQNPSAVAVLGDNQYQSGLLREFYGAGAYNDTWGQFNPVVHPAPGNHEYAKSSTAAGYFTYFGSSAGEGYYSYDLGAWHVISLNSDCDDSGCQDSLAGTTSSAQVSWLQADLAAHRNQCTLAYWHHPRFSSGWVGNSPGVAPFWEALYAARADVVLNGHDHMYERFAPQDPWQRPVPDGIREFVAGTGGESLFTIGAIQPNMQALDNDDFGVLFLTLHPGGYDWAFKATDGGVRDTGAAPCHSAPAAEPPAPPPAGHVAGLSAAAPAPFRFTAKLQRFTARVARRHGLPVLVHCSRACDLRIWLRARRGRGLRTLAAYRRTETEITRPWSRTVLRLPRAASVAALLSRTADARLDFVAVDAHNERRGRRLVLLPVIQRGARR